MHRQHAAIAMTAAISVAALGGCQSTTARPAGEAIASVPRTGTDIDFIERLESSPRVTWADVLTGAAMTRGVPLSALSDDAAVLAHADSLGLLEGAPPRLDSAVTVLDVAAVTSRALGEPVHNDAEARRAITRLDTMGVLAPNTQPGWTLSGTQLIGVMAGISDQLSWAERAARQPDAGVTAPHINPWSSGRPVGEH